MTHIETKISKRAFGHIESELSAYPEIRREMNQIRSRIMNQTSQDENTGGGRSSLPSDPTGAVAVSLVSDARLAHLERISAAIEEVVNKLPEIKKKLVQLRYWARPQIYTLEGIADQLHISARQARRWKREIICAIANIVGFR